MINWNDLRDLLNLYENFYRIYEILEVEEYTKYRDLIQEWSDRLYKHIRKVYLDYTYVVGEEVNE